MGSICALCLNTDEQDLATHSPKSNNSNETPKEKKTRYIPKSWKRNSKIPHRIYQPPFIYDKTEIMFLVSDNASNYLSKYYLKKLNDGSITEQEIKCDNDDESSRINLAKSVYTLNNENNKIYFLESNKCIKVLDLNNNSISSLNKEISVANNNQAHIGYYQGGVHVFGAESITNNEEKDDDYISPHPTGSFTKQVIKGDDTQEIPLVYDFGLYSRCLQVKDQFLMVGGIKNTKIADEDMGDIEISISIPNEQIFLGKYGDNSKWIEKSLNVTAHSFGIINYRDEFLVRFGGIEWKGKTKSSDSGSSSSVQSAPRKRTPAQPAKKSDYIYLLPLKANNQYKVKLLQGRWYRFNRLKLPSYAKGYIHALYPPMENNKDDNVILFTYYGRNWTMSMDDIINELKNGSDEDIQEVHNWAHTGKTTLPTKSSSFKNLGPAPDDEVAAMLRELDGDYLDYVNTIGFASFDELLAQKNEDELKKVIKNKLHYKVIRDKAEEKQKAKQGN